MKKDAPVEFLKEYEARRKELDDALEQIASLLKLRLSQLASRTGVRARITEKRVKRPGKLWRRAEEKGLCLMDSFAQVEDLLGLRMVCNNLSDIAQLVEMIDKDMPTLQVVKVKEMGSQGEIYKATHVRTHFRKFYNEQGPPIPCELQIRTLAQDTLARLSREDLYDKKVPNIIEKIASALSTHLSAIDDLAQVIRDELNKCPEAVEKMEDSDPVSPQRLALLYRDKFGEEIYEWSLVEWIRNLHEAEADRIRDVRKLLEDNRLREALNERSDRIRGHSLENSEWAVFSALVATEATLESGIEVVAQRIQQEWDEIVSFARGEALSEMPDTLEGLMEMVRSGRIPTDALRELGGIQDCDRCGNEILRPEQAAFAVLDYYHASDDGELEELLERVSPDDAPEVESADFSGVCQYCGYQMSKDD